MLGTGNSPLRRRSACSVPAQIPKTRLAGDFLPVSLDVGLGTSLDVGLEAFLDVGLEASLDVGLEDFLDVGLEASLDVGLEPSLDMGFKTLLAFCFLLESPRLLSEVGMDSESCETVDCLSTHGTAGTFFLERGYFIRASFLFSPIGMCDTQNPLPSAPRGLEGISRRFLNRWLGFRRESRDFTSGKPVFALHLRVEVFSMILSSKTFAVGGRPNMPPGHVTSSNPSSLLQTQLLLLRPLAKQYDFIKTSESWKTNGTWKEMNFSVEAN